MDTSEAEEILHKSKLKRDKKDDIILYSDESQLEDCDSDKHEVYKYGYSDSDDLEKPSKKDEKDAEKSSKNIMKVQMENIDNEANPVLAHDGDKIMVDDR
jgi:hypothetical protein